jgi:O-antigen/teichoic acid export membrane protein
MARNGVADPEPSEVTVAGNDRGGSFTLARAASGSFLLNIVNTGATVLVTIVLARTMEVAGFGLYSWIASVVMLLSIPAVLGVDRLVIRDVAVYLSRDEHGLARGLVKRATQLVLVMCFLIGIGAALVAALMGEALSYTTMLAFAFGLIALLFLALGRVAQSALMGFRQVVLAQLPEYALRPLLLLLLVAAAYLILGPPLDPVLVVLLYAASIGGALLAAVLLLRARTPRPMKMEEPHFMTRSWAMGAVALAFLSAAMVVNMQAGVFMLGVLEGTESAGLYAVAQRAALLISFPLAAVNVALAPTAARLWARAEKARLQRLVTFSARGVVLLSLPLALGFILFGGFILSLLFGPAFSAGAEALTILSVGQLANAVTGSVGTLLVMTGNQRRAALGISAGALLNVGLAVALIPSLGVLGAAVAEASAAVFSNVLLVAVVWRQLGINTTALGGLRERHRRAG